MDFIRLAVREVRKNSSRTGIAIAATALATVILVLSRIVPQGYMRNQAIAERAFAGADILVWTAPTHVRAEDRTDLEWRAWTGEGWQSFAEYFIPSLPTEGYVCPSVSAPWRPLNERQLSESLTQVQGVDRVEPYLSFPCKARVGDEYVDVILRGRTPDEASFALSMDGQVRSGRPLGPEDRGLPNALVPLVSEPHVPFTPQGELEITLPRLVEGEGGAEYVWSDPIRRVLTQVGTYAVQIGEIPGLSEPEGPGGEATPEYWERPEILVDGNTFAALVSDALDGTGTGAPPSYQMLVTVSRPSETKLVVDRIRETLGTDYAVFSIAELAGIRTSGGGQQIITKDMSPVVTSMILTMAAGIVAGSVYVLLALQTRKIGLLRAIGATSKDILIYVLGVIIHTTITGVGIGFLIGKLIVLTVLAATDFTLAEWLKMTAVDALLSLSGLLISIGLGFAVAFWASRIPCAEVLRRE